MGNYMNLFKEFMETGKIKSNNQLTEYYNILQKGGDNEVKHEIKKLMNEVVESIKKEMLIKYKSK